MIETSWIHVDPGQHSGQDATRRAATGHFSGATQLAGKIGQPQL